MADKRTDKSDQTPDRAAEDLFSKDAIVQQTNQVEVEDLSVGLQDRIPEELFMQNIMEITPERTTPYASMDQDFVIKRGSNVETGGKLASATLAPTVQSSDASLWQPESKYSAFGPQEVSLEKSPSLEQSNKSKPEEVSSGKIGATRIDSDAEYIPFTGEELDAEGGRYSNPPPPTTDVSEQNDDTPNVGTNSAGDREEQA